jgi:hypothetical protein
MPFKEWVSSTKDTVSTIREVAIVILVIVFLFNQHFIANYLATYASTLAQAGSAQGAKTEVDTPLAKYTFDHSTDALTSLNSAKSTSDDSIKQLEALKKSVSSSQVVDQIDAVEQSLRSTGQAVDQSIKTTQALQSQTVAEIPNGPTSAAAAPSPFGISVAADRVREHAVNEVQLLKTNNITNIAVYLRNGLYITVARFSDRNAADSQLTAIRAFRPTAYLINIGSFCHNPSVSSEKIDTVNVTNCQ